MKQWVNISDAVEITNNRVKPFKGKRRYLATGDLIGDAVNESIVSVDYDNKPSRADLLVEEGNVIVARMQATNKVLLIDEATEDLIVSTGFLTLQPKKDFDSSYLAHYFRSDVFQKKRDKYCSGATQKAINNGAFAKLQVPRYSLDEQKRIASILDQADALRQKRKQSLQLLDDFLCTAFLDMFGDTVVNPRKWKKAKLGDISDIQGGVQVSHKRSNNPLEVPYLRVANVYRDRLALDEIKTIRVTESELQRTRLIKGDVLIVEGHGNREEIGRTAVWDGSINPCIHQNHLIRIRLDDQVVLPIYLSNYVNSDGGRRQLFAMGKTTSGLNTISTSNVKSLMIMLPPVDEQQKYQRILSEVEETKQRMRNSLAELDNQFNALTQRYFG